MAIEKTVEREILIKASGHFEIKETPIYSEDGVVTRGAPHRRTISPGDPVDAEDAEIKGLATTAHTAERIEKVRRRAS